MSVLAQGDKKAAGTIGAVALALVIAYTLFCVAFEAVTWNDINGGYYGWNLGSDGSTIISVTPGSAVEKAGIVAGDRVEWKTLPLLGRSNLVLNVAPPLGSRLTCTILHGKNARVVSLDPLPWEEHAKNGARVGFLIDLILIGIGVALVRLRPSAMTWGFLLMSIPVPFTYAQSDPLRFFAIYGWSAIVGGAGTAGMFKFISRFPKNSPQGALLALDRSAVPIGVLISGLLLLLHALVVFSSVPPPQWLIASVETIVPVVVAVAAIVGLIVSYTQTTSSDRQRILPVLASFALLTLTGVMTTFYNVNFTGGVGLNVVDDLNDVATILFAVAVAHGIVKHRVIDLSFALSRTLVYTLLTSILLGAFTLIDVLSARLFEHLQIALVLEALVALAFGIWLKRLHARVDDFVDRVLFRRRYLAQERVNRTARVLMHAENAGFVDEALTIEAAGAFDLTSAAVFRAEGSGFVRALAQGWADNEFVTSVSNDDHLVVNLRAELRAIDLLTVRWPRTDVPGGLAHPILAIPLVVRHELLGFVLYGGHNGGEAIDPDEQATLVHLAHAAASAYEHIRAKTLIVESSTLRTENEILQRERLLLREVVDSLTAT